MKKFKNILRLADKISFSVLLLVAYWRIPELRHSHDLILFLATLVCMAIILMSILVEDYKP